MVSYIIYVVTVKSVHCVLWPDTLPISILRRCHYAQNLPTQKASEKERAWFQKENEDCRRQKRSEEKTCKGQKETDLLISYYPIVMKERRPMPILRIGLFPLVGKWLRNTSLLLGSALDVDKLRRRVSPCGAPCLASPFPTSASCENQIFVLFFTRAYMRVRAGGQAAVAM